MSNIIYISEFERSRFLNSCVALFESLALHVYILDEVNESYQSLARMPDKVLRLVDFLFGEELVGELPEFLENRLEPFLQATVDLTSFTTSWRDTEWYGDLVIVARSNGKKIGIHSTWTNTELFQCATLREAIQSEYIGPNSGWADDMLKIYGPSRTPRV
ncbi:MAG: hypothetical protein O9248_00480 [Rhodobacteraceae bacterium]|nr:hypothetical protein [Paracoccaceae bacterium]